ncbi:flagellar assembly peptidoglycan hydrolase FlgJ [Rhodoferax sp. U2-2l]|uniref:flagellar assembly peptidoglycan hydrolase FlgJ n=1 Tax=Rhodoferax sp. U2-2l TaxID=2884000 RepID=UPI001D0A1F8E|nr:flagellar assembly peptidoglycan hydrolase FlgJ [Rhodoferax sp. U2-2l]MCB8748191.1 flagellar assembly peptidoglycan hydrolase FlgJ [Rhodoferax sp. U2-2l]
MNIAENSISNALAADANSLGKLKLQAGRDSPAAIRETAKQFESLFMRELIKSMREATMKSGMLDNAGSDLGTDLLDQQFAVQMSGQPGGLSDLIAAQLAQQMGVSLPPGALSAGKLTTPPMSAMQKSSSLAAYSANAVKPTSSQGQFVERHTASAMRIERETGIPASYMVGQAGHETGWGKHNIRMRDGSSSNNLFGIKAGAGWKGPVAEVTTTEYVNGVAEKRVAKFRAYASTDESFRDYARLITQSPRYAQVTQQTGSAQAFASSLQKAGYATDPHYATKLSRAIETTQRLQQRMTMVASAS